MVNLSLSTEQTQIVDMVGRALAERGARDATAVLEELGVADMRAPESAGGAGASLFDAALVAEAAGGQGVVAFPDDRTRLLRSAAAVGMARRALMDAAAYARERIVFGRPIGAYQGVAHTLAARFIEVDGARLLIWRAIAALAERSADAAALEAQAFWWAARASTPAIAAAMRVFGGYGMTEDSLLPTLYRSARAVMLEDGDPDQALLSVGAERLPDPGATAISFAAGDEAATWSARTEAFLADNFPPEDKAAFASADDNHLAGPHRRLAEAGLLFPDWSAEWGGADASPFATSAVRRALGRGGWPLSVLLVSDMIGKLVMRFGTEEAKTEILPRLARGEALGCLGMSETTGGSDVFAAKTRATPAPDGWIVNGQKVFTTSAHIADYVLLLTKTDEGLTLFAAPTASPGFECQPIQTFAGERTNITFYTDFPIDRRYLLGEVGKGGQVLAATLSLEHNLGDYYLGALGQVEAELTTHWDDLLALPGLGERRHAITLSLARLQAHIALLESLSIRSLWAGEAGVSERWYGPMCKVFGTEAWAAMCAELVERFAPHSLSGRIPALAALEAEARRGIPATIYGGTSEIQRSVIAETALGLPRSR